MNENDIIILGCGLEIKEEIVFKNVKDDSILIDAINKYESELDNNIDVFNKKQNIIVTENGYFLAVYKKDILVE